MVKKMQAKNTQLSDISINNNITYPQFNHFPIIPFSHYSSKKLVHAHLLPSALQLSVVPTAHQTPLSSLHPLPPDPHTPTTVAATTTTSTHHAQTTTLSLSNHHLWVTSSGLGWNREDRFGDWRANTRYVHEVHWGCVKLCSSCSSPIDSWLVVRGTRRWVVLLCRLSHLHHVLEDQWSPHWCCSLASEPEVKRRNVCFPVIFRWFQICITGPKENIPIKTH